MLNGNYIELAACRDNPAFLAALEAVKEAHRQICPTASEVRKWTIWAKNKAVMVLSSIGSSIYAGTSAFGSYFVDNKDQPQ